MNSKSKLAVLGLAVAIFSLSQVASADVFVRRGSDPVGAGNKMIGVIRSSVSTLDNGMTIVGKSSKAPSKDLSIFIPSELARKTGFDLLTLASLISDRKVDVVCESLDGQITSNLEVHFASH